LSLFRKRVSRSDIIYMTNGDLMLDLATVLSQSENHAKGFWNAGVKLQKLDANGSSTKWIDGY